MSSFPRSLAVAAVLATSAIAPIALAASAEAAPAYSVSVEYCRGGISVVGYANANVASKALVKLVHKQTTHPRTVKTVQLRHGRQVVKASNLPC